MEHKNLCESTCVRNLPRFHVELLTWERALCLYVAAPQVTCVRACVRAYDQAWSPFFPDGSAVDAKSCRVLCFSPERGRCSQSSDGQHAAQRRHARWTHAPGLLSSKKEGSPSPSPSPRPSVRPPVTHPLLSSITASLPLPEPLLSLSFCLLLLF